jgi:hypothetical protein
VFGVWIPEIMNPGFDLSLAYKFNKVCFGLFFFYIGGPVRYLGRMLVRRNFGFLCVFDESPLCDRSSAYVTAIRADETGSFNELIK